MITSKGCWDRLFNAASRQLLALSFDGWSGPGNKTVGWLGITAQQVPAQLLPIDGQ